MPEPNNDFHRVSQGEGGRGAARRRGRQLCAARSLPRPALTEPYPGRAVPLLAAGRETVRLSPRPGPPPGGKPGAEESPARGLGGAP